MGKALDVDLSKGTIQELTIDPADRDLYWGGRGLATRLLYDHTPAGLDPYDEEMVLIFSTGPLTGSGAPQSNRFVVTTKSPLTGAIANSTCGGNFATKLKKAGVDLVLIRGKADKPVYLEITEDEAQIKDASHLWGMKTQEVQKEFPRAFGKAVIGPAGENKVRFAAIVSQERIAGRTGCGAVMGAKNLKAIVANGRKKLPLADPERFKKLQKQHTQYLLEHPMTGDILPRLGTANIVHSAAGKNILPVNNFQTGSDERAVNITGGALAKHHLKKQVGCLACPILCGRGIHMHNEAAAAEGAPAAKPKVTKGPEYETIALVGSNIGCYDLPKIFEWNELCDELGMDTVSTGGALGFATELTQKGMLESELSFDNHDGISQMLDDIAHRRGLGDDLAEGVKRMGDKFGGADFAIHAKGLELPAYDPRGCYGQGLEYATSNRGGCHTQGGIMYLEATGALSLDPHATATKPEWAFYQQNVQAAVSSSVFCMFATYGMLPGLVNGLKPMGALHRSVIWVLLHSGPILRMYFKANLPVQAYWFEKFLTHAFGRRISTGEFNKVGERVFNMERLYNLREGLTAADDTLPKRMLDESTFDGIDGGVPLDRMLPAYYKLRGWDSQGVPKPKTLQKLSIRA